MRLPTLTLPHATQTTSWGPVWIGVGLGALVGNAWLPALPVMTAMALVALGATAVTVERFHGRPRASLVVVLNLVVYGGLYVLFVGATLHHAGALADHRLGILTVIDLAVSALPLTTTIAASWQALRSGESVG